MKSLLDSTHFGGLFLGFFLACDAIGNLETTGHNVVGELAIALGLMALSFIAYTIKHRI